MPKMTPEDWMIEIENGLEYRRLYGFEDAWDRLEQDFYNSPHGHTSVGSNLIYSMGDSLLSGITVPEPEFTIMAEHPNSVDKVPTLEAVDNWLTRKTRLKAQVEQCELHNYLKGKAIMKLGYDSEWGFDPDYDIGNLTGEPEGMTFTQFDKQGNRIEYNDYQPGMPWARPVNPKDFVVPWGCRELEDARWVAHRVIRLNAGLKKDRKYKNTKNLEPQISMEAYMNEDRKVHRGMKNRYDRTSVKSYQQNSVVVYNELWEIRDRRTGEILVITRDYDKFLRKDLDALQLYGIPYVATNFVQGSRSFWTTPQAYYLGQLQADMYDIAVQSTKTRRLSVLKFMANKKEISQDEVDKFISGDVGAVGFHKGNRNAKDVITPVNTVNNYNYMVDSNAVRSDAREAIGYSRNQTGEFDSSSRRTAREVSQVAAGSDKRERRRIDNVRQMYGDTIKGYNNFVFTFWTKPRSIMQDNKPVTFTGNELKGDYSYSVMLNTKRIVGKSERKVEAMLVLQQFAGLIPPEKMGVLLDYLVSAAADPSFEKLIGAITSTGQGQQQPQLSAGQV